MRRIALSLLGLMLGAASASAADLAARPYTKAPPSMVAAYNWSGFYVGIHGGWAESDPRFDFVDAGHYNLAAGDSFRLKGDGFMVGGQGGYNWQIDKFLIGIEGSGSYTDINTDAISPFFPGTDTFHAKIRWMATVTPRVGITSGPALFYVKGGVAFADLWTRIQDTFDFNERSETRAGWTVGGGVEYMASQNWIVGVEGNYYDFGHCCGGQQQSRILATGAPDIGTFSNHSVRFDTWSVLGRVSYKFGSPVVAKY